MKEYIKQPNLLVFFLITASFSCSSIADEENKNTSEKTTSAIVDPNPNRFNRILIKSNAVNPSAKDDGLHDIKNTSLIYLQKPAEAFKDLPKARSGNRVDWGKAIESGKIKPRHDLNDPDVEAMVMDLNIVMQVKGSMPDIVYPHKKHTQWLDCANCHPAIFIPKAGANKMSMADNLLGKKCGVCHGKVAFPLSNCTKCHSNKKVIVKGK